MKIILINNSKLKMPRKFIHLWMKLLWKQLVIRGVFTQKKINKKSLKDKASELTILFLSKQQAKNINFKFRQKNYATDVLSFTGFEESLGELVICPEVIRGQAIEHGFKFSEELGYMLIHGTLHLLGFEHEKSKIEANRMFQIQDDVFDDLCRIFWK